MPEPTLSEVFGASASQTASVLTIQKSDLTGVGLTATASNTAESLVVALVLLFQRNLTELARSADYANRNVTVFPGGADLPTQGGQVYRRDSFSILLYRPEATTPIDPDNY